MREIGKAVLILATVGLLTGCRMYEEQKQAIVQTVSAAVLSPFVNAQRTTPLTQGDFKPAATVAPQSTAETPVEREPAVEPLVVERHVVKPVKPCGARVVTSSTV